MKRFLFGIALAMSACLAIPASAQTTTQKLTTTAADTMLTNADTSYLNLTAVNNYDLTFQYTLAKVSGTVAGSAILQGSVDGTNWVAVKNSALYTANTDSQTLTDVSSQVFQWVVPRSPFSRYRIRVITTGTSVAKPSGIVLLHSYK